MKTIDYSYFIESFIAGEMSPAEEVWFKKELEGNESLQKEVTLRKQADVIMRKNDVISLRNKLASIEKMRQAKPVSNGRLKTPRFRYAAALAGMVVMGSIFFTLYRPMDPDKIFDKYSTTKDNNITTRSTETNFLSADDNFDKGNYLKATEGYISYLATHAWMAEYELRLGISFMKVGNMPEAKTSFGKVIDDNNSLFIEEANWRLALCYLKTNDMKAAKVQLRKVSKSTGSYKVQARRILRHI